MTFWDKYKFRIFHPNVLTISRGVIGLFLPFLILQPNPWGHLFGLFLFIMGGVTDYWDGKIARKHNLESPIGRYIDPFSDKILILGPLTAFAALKFYSIWWIVPIFIREIIVTFCRTGWVLEGKSMGAEKMGKRKFGFQVALVSVSFVYLLLNPYPYFILEWAARFFYYTLPVLLLIVIYLTLVSGVSFLWNQRALFTSEAFNKYVLAVGVGFFPKAPGTWGSMLGLLLVFLTHWNGWLYGAVFLFLAVWGAWSYERIKDPNPDPQYIVIDEVCGIFVTFMMIPLNWVSALLGFALFRVFDMFKPFPIRALERIPRYWGILADDLGAGFYAWIILLIFFR